MDYDSKYNQKVYLIFQAGQNTFIFFIIAIGEILKEHTDKIIAIGEILKEHTDKNRNFVFIYSQINVLLNFTLEKSITCYILQKNIQLFFHLDILTRRAKENILKVVILHYLFKIGFSI